MGHDDGDKAIWLEKMLFGMYWLFLVVLAEKNLFVFF